MILPWILLFSINKIKKELKSLKNNQMPDFHQKTKIPMEPSPLPADVVSPLKKAKISSSAEQPVNMKSLEQNFGHRISVWIGGVALALAGLYLIQYSIEAGLLGPKVRLLLSILFGIGLLAAGQYVWQWQELDNRERIAQAITSSGICVLYFSSYAATILYGFFPSIFGFIGMCIVTLITVLMALQQGIPIALLGLTGGFLTPILIGSKDPSIITLYIYLYFLSAGFLYLCRRQGWVALRILIHVIDTIWVITTLFNSNLFGLGDHSVALQLFVLALFATDMGFFRNRDEKDTLPSTNLLENINLKNASVFLPVGLGAIVMTVICSYVEMGVYNWILFELLCIGGGLLTLVMFKTYNFVPPLMLFLSTVLFGFSKQVDVVYGIGIISSLWLIHGVIPIVFRHLTKQKVYWGIMGYVSTIVYFLSIYFLWGPQAHKSLVANEHYWGWSCMLLAAMSVALAIRSWKANNNREEREKLFIIDAASVISFVSIASAILLPVDFWIVAFALEFAGLAWIYHFQNIKSIQYLSMFLLSGIFIFLISDMTDYIATMGFQPDFGNTYILSFLSLSSLGLTTLGLLSGLYFYRQSIDNQFIKATESIICITVVLVITMVLSETITHLINSPNAKYLFFTRSLYTLSIYGLGCVLNACGLKFNRDVFAKGGLLLIGLALWRTVVFDLLFCNPLLSAQYVLGYPIFNGLIITYLLPCLFLLYIYQSNRDLFPKWRTQLIYGLCYLLVFVWLSYAIRQMYQGHYLHHWDAAHAEIYTYSIVWLLYGIILLFIGVRQNEQTIRWGGLLMIVSTIVKVFLYDASHLQGLWRVLSFLILGSVLICLSWFYTRFIEKTE